jgi:hypothetical protein
VGLAIALFLPASLPASAALDAPAYLCDNERLGFAFLRRVDGVSQSIGDYSLAPLKAGWYVNWGVAPEAHPAGLDFAQTLWMVRNPATKKAEYAPSGAELAYYVERSPAALWLVGNEPDSIYQDNTTPEEYARVYHDAYHEIKRFDPAAQVAIGGMIQATPLRLQWLDATWAAYQRLYGATMPVDVWNVHNFVLREVRRGAGGYCMATAGFADDWEWGAWIPPGINSHCGLYVKVEELDRLDLFREQLVRFRTWMRDHGQQNKPLVVSEFGMLGSVELGYGFERVRNYMVSAFDYMVNAKDPAIGYPADDYRLVQRAVWYSLNDTSFEGGTTLGALADPRSHAYTGMGHAFAAYAGSLAQRCVPYVDMQPRRVRLQTVAPVRFGDEGRVRIEVEVRNQGTAASGPTQVGFWAGTQFLGTAPLASVPPDHQGIVTAALEWSGVAAGDFSVTVEVDPAMQIPESQDTNNRLTVTATFGAYSVSVAPAGWQQVSYPLRPGEPTQINLLPEMVTYTRTAGATPGLEVLPPMLRAAWYDGDPLAGGMLLSETSFAPTVAAGGQFPVAQLSWAPVMTGPRTAWFTAGMRSGVPEAVATDNRAAAQVPAVSDFAVIEVQQVPPYTQWPGMPSEVLVRARLASRGTLPPPAPLQVAVRPAGGSEVGRGTLEPTGDWTAPIAWTNLPVGLHPYTAMVDPDNLIVESDESNNVSAGTARVPKGYLILPLSNGGL